MNPALQPCLASVEIDGIGIYTNPPVEYLDWVSRTGAFLDGPDWGEIIHTGLGAQVSYVWDKTYCAGHILACFTKGPFRVAYLGFPICASPYSASAPCVLNRMIDAVRKMTHRPHLLRIPVSAFDNAIFNPPPNAKALATIESCISDLPQWHAESVADRRRDFRAAQRRCQALETVSGASGDELYSLYRAAIGRNRGKQRYTREYFLAITRALTSSQISLFALRDGSEIVSMIITLRHGDTSYYLHSGTRAEFLRHGASDLLMRRAIESAQIAGALRFNFLSSPLGQPGLVRFKEKWGGESRIASTANIAMGLMGHGLSNLLNRQ